MVIRCNSSESEPSECKICLPCAIISSLIFSIQLQADASTNLPFQTTGIKRGSSNFGSLSSCKDIKCMLRSGCSSPLGQLVRRVCAERESIKQALH